MKRFFRWPALTLLAALVIAAGIASLLLATHSIKPSSAHAASNTGNTPTLTLPDTISAFTTVPVTAQGYLPGDTVYLWATSSIPIATLHCDPHGNYFGQVFIYAFDPQGTYQITGYAMSGRSAQTTTTLLPGVNLTNPVQYGSIITSGGPGTELTLNGGAFNSNETATVYWGQTKESTVTADYNGNFQYTFNTPKNATPGNYTVSVTRTNQSPATVSTPFTILPPALKSPAGIRDNQAAHIKLSGFQAGEKVTLSWNANNGQTITTLSADITGADATYIAMPSAPKGAYMLTATGKTSKLQATSPIRIGAGIILDTNTANPGGSITVEGGGYTPGETVNVFFQTTKNGIMTATVDNTGAFNVSLSIPVAYKKSIQYFVYANSIGGLDQSKAKFFYTTPSLQLTCCSNLSYGYSFSIAGQGFVANDTVNILWEFTSQKYPQKLGSVIAASDGTFKFTASALSAPYSSYHQSNVLIVATGHQDHTNASLSLYEQTSIVASPTQGPIGTKVRITGGAFGSNEMVTITLGNIQVATTTTKNDGRFVTTFIVPANAPLGGNVFDLGAIGNTSGAVASTGFFVVPNLSITPSKGPSGTVITVTGSHCTPSNIDSLYWYDPSTKGQNFLTHVTVSSTGDFQTTITAPANLVSGHTYDVLLVDYLSLSNEVPFVAQ